jgi:hypothetical protein
MTKEWIPKYVRVRIVYLIPVCCGKKMVQYSGGRSVGRRRYYKCTCGNKAPGSVHREEE